MPKEKRDTTAQPVTDAEAQAQASSAQAQPVNLGQLAFNAYNAKAGGKTYDGKDVPAWADLGEAVQANWEASARAVMEEAQKAYTIEPVSLPDLTPQPTE